MTSVRAALRVMAVLLFAALAVGMHAPFASAETEGQAIVAAAQAIQSQSYPRQAFSSAQYVYCFDGGTTSGATVGGYDDYSDGSYDDCDEVGHVGFDCRGLALYAVYQGTNHAVTLPTSTAQAQYSDASSYGGSYISLSSVQPGDLVFFGYSASEVEHVGIVVSGTGTSAEIVSAVSEKYGIETYTVHWFEGQFSWVRAVAIPGVGDTGGGSPPSITSVLPDEGAIGTPVTISGSGLANASSVTFNGTPATISSDTDTAIATSVPTGATTGNIVVTTPSGTGTAAFTVDDGSSEETPGMVLNQTSFFDMTLVRGPNDSLDAYWNTIGQSWNGPSVVAGPGTTFSAPAMVINQSSDFIMAVVEGPDNTLDAYWDTVGQPWNGPAQVGAAGSTYSAPAVVLNQATNFASALVEGPDHSLDVYWVTIGQPWSGPVVVGGAGTTYSAPAAVLDESSNFESALVQGPDHSLDVYWVTIGQPWSGPGVVGGAGTTYSAPAAVLNESSNFESALVEGPNNSLENYWVTIGQPWNGPAVVGGAGSAYSQPIAVLDPGTNFVSTLVEGPGNSLYDYWVTIGRPWNGPAIVAGASSTYAIVGQVLLHPASTLVALTQGASNTLDAYWVQLGQPWNGPALVAGDGTTFVDQTASSGEDGSGAGSGGSSTGGSGTNSGGGEGNGEPPSMQGGSGTTGSPLSPTAGPSARIQVRGANATRTALTSKQRLAKALAACRKVKSRHKRAECERAAKKRYGGRSRRQTHHRGSR